MVDDKVSTLTDDVMILKMAIWANLFMLLLLIAFMFHYFYRNCNGCRRRTRDIDKELKYYLDNDDDIVLHDDNGPFLGHKRSRWNLTSKLVMEAKIQFGVRAHTVANRMMVREFVLKNIQSKYPTMRLRHKLELIEKVAAAVFVVNEEEIKAVELLTSDEAQTRNDYMRHALQLIENRVYGDLFPQGGRD